MELTMTNTDLGVGHVYPAGQDSSPIAVEPRVARVGAIS
jgi:hypothetical protein